VQGFVIGTATKRSNGLEIKGRDIKFLASTLADILKQPVINRTGMTGKFDIILQWDSQPKNLSEMNAALDQLGLELTPSREPTDVLVVKQAR
jgi:uncharacterized protein (TIGR03435 family)